MLLCCTSLQVPEPLNLYDQPNSPIYLVNQITSQLNASSDSLQDIRIATQVDDELALLKHTIMSGLPSTIREFTREIHPYWTFREELTVEDWKVLKGTHIVIPTKNVKVYLTLYTKDIWVLINVS